MTSSDARAWQMRYLVQRDGDRCLLADASCKGEIVIDHINGIRNDERTENLRLLCASHNRREGIRLRRSPESEREKKYSSGSSEMQINIDTEPPYRRWLLNCVMEDGFVPKDTAINGGAEVLQLSPTTTRKHLAKITDAYGPLKIIRHPHFGRIVVMRSVEEMA